MSRFRDIQKKKEDAFQDRKKKKTEIVKQEENLNPRFGNYHWKESADE